MSASAKIKILCVPPFMLDDVLPLARGHLRRGAAAAGTTRRELERDLQSGNALLWLAIEGKRVLAAWLASPRRDERDDSDVLVLYGLGGNGVRRWIGRLADTMTHEAKRQGLRAVRFAGRRGWERAAPNVTLLGVYGSAREFIFERRVTA